MPRANRDMDTAPVRYPRTLFAHAHEDSGVNVFPVDFAFENQRRMFIAIPDNWNGLDAIYVVLRGGLTEAITVNTTINIGTCDELWNIHTQTINGTNINLVTNEYECFDLATIHATVLANLQSNDILYLNIFMATGDQTHHIFGLVLQES